MSKKDVERGPGARMLNSMDLEGAGYICMCMGTGVVMHACVDI